MSGVSKVPAVSAWGPGFGSSAFTQRLGMRTCIPGTRETETSRRLELAGRPRWWTPGSVGALPQNIKWKGIQEDNQHWSLTPTGTCFPAPTCRGTQANTYRYHTHKRKLITKMRKINPNLIEESFRAISLDLQSRLFANINILSFIHLVTQQIRLHSIYFLFCFNPRSSAGASLIYLFADFEFCVCSVQCV